MPQPESPYHRKKQPELVRRTLLDMAARIAIEQGSSAVTVQAVADAAGVTKGGLLHHFPSKQALLEAVFADTLERLDTRLDAHMADDPVAHGRFTRAYVAVTLAPDQLEARSPIAALSFAVLGDRSLDPLWEDWINSRIARHAKTDDDPMLQIVRFAADGAWFAYVAADTPHDLDGLRERLLEMTLRA